MAGALLELESLGKDYGSTVALRTLTCQVRAGEIVGLLGPNGAGKTTTLKLLLGLLRPSRGSARFLGLDCTADARKVKEKIGYTPDEPAFYDFLTGRETVDFVLNVRGCASGAWDRMAPLVDRMEFSEALDVAVGGYSHGMKKKLALIVALAHDPALLLLDEPTNGLDPPTAARVRALLRAYAERGGGVLVSTHLLTMAEQLCDRVLVLHEGSLIAEGSPAEVIAASKVGDQATLEDAFLKLVE